MNSWWLVLEAARVYRRLVGRWEVDGEKPNSGPGFWFPRISLLGAGLASWGGTPRSGR